MKKLIIAAGSPSTIFAVAGFCQANDITPNDFRNGNVGVIFTQAFQVGEGSFAWQNAMRNDIDQFVVIGLPVNNRDPKMTEILFKIIGDRLVGVYDEHEAERWAALREQLVLSPELFHTPGKDEGHLSAASIIGNVFPAMSRLWVEAGDWADNRQLEVSSEAKALATDIDSAIKVLIADNEFRVTAILHLLGDPSATETFNARLAEGKVIAAATEKALQNAELQGGGTVLVVRQPEGVEINQTAAMFAGYARAPFVAITGVKSGEASQEVVVVGCDNKHPRLGKTNLLEVLSELSPSGIAGKATVYGVENLNKIVQCLYKVR